MHAERTGERRDLLLHAAWRAADVRAMERPLLQRGVPLMRMAAEAAAHVAAQMLDDEGIDLDEASVVLLAGGGDNGGDGLYVAAALAEEGARVACVAVGRTLHAEAFAALVRAGGKVLVLDPAGDIPGCPSGFSAGEAGKRLGAAVELARSADLLIDAMTGIGLDGSLRGLPGTVASLLGLRPDEDGHVALPDAPALPDREPAGGLPLVLAIDTPSGIGVDDGTLPGPVIPADVTVTFGAMKPCAMLPPATFACGRLVLVDFDFDLTAAAPAALAVDDATAADAVRLPHADDSKYSRGVVGLITGSARYPGAAVLTATAAARSNAGMVRYLGPERAQDMVLAALPEAVMGKGHVQAWVVGSGVPDAAGDPEERDAQRATIARLLAHYSLDDADELDDDPYDMPPIVVDAGALDLLPDHVPPQVVLTPHAGELARLVERIGVEAAGSAAHASHDAPVRSESVAVDDVLDEPLRYARFAADATGATVLLKGAATLIVTPNDGAQTAGDGDDARPAPAPVLVCGKAPAWLATAGAGDVLAGALGALLAQNADDMDEFESSAIARIAASGALLHGAAAALASQSDQRGWDAPRLFGQPVQRRIPSSGHPIVASDVIRAVPEAIADLIS